jgi:hypothetical protein
MALSPFRLRGNVLNCDQFVEKFLCRSIRNGLTMIILDTCRSSQVLRRIGEVPSKQRRNGKIPEL